MNPIDDLTRLFADVLAARRTGDRREIHELLAGRNVSEESLEELKSLERDHDILNSLPPLGEHSRYVDSEPIGQGGMGYVYRVRDKELNRHVILKLAKPWAKASLVHEINITATLDHPNIIRLFDKGVINGAPFFTMPEVKQERWSQLIAAAHSTGIPRPSARPFRMLLENFLAVCAAVGHAHAQGVAHCDLKPGNVQIGDTGEVIVLDWGLARRIPGPPDQGNIATSGECARFGSAMETGTRFATLPYTAPEQFSDPEGKDQLPPMDHRADIYALGAILYEILAGKPPFVGDRFDILEAKMLEAKKHVSPVDALRVAKGSARAPLVSICATAMAPDPNSRYTSALELRQHVAVWLLDDWVPVHRYRAKECLALIGRRYSSWVQAIGAAALLVIVGLLVAFFMMKTAYDAKDQALASEKEARDKEAHQRKIAQQAEATAEQNEQTAQQQARRAKVRGDLALRLMTEVIASHQFDKVFADITTQQAISDSLYDDLKRSTTEIAKQGEVGLANQAAIRLMLAGMKQDSGDKQEAIAHFREALNSDLPKLALESSDAAEAYALAYLVSYLGDLCIKLGTNEEKAAYCEQVSRLLSARSESKPIFDDAVAIWLVQRIYNIGGRFSRENGVKEAPRCYELAEIAFRHIGQSVDRKIAYADFLRSRSGFKLGSKKTMEARQDCETGMTILGGIEPAKRSTFEWLMAASSLWEASGDIFLAEKNWSMAEQDYGESIKVLQGLIGAKRFEKHPLRNRAQMLLSVRQDYRNAARRYGVLAEADDILERAKEAIARRDHKMLEALARKLVDLGPRDEAGKLYLIAARYFGMTLGAISKDKKDDADAVAMARARLVPCVMNALRLAIEKDRGKKIDPAEVRRDAAFASLLEEVEFLSLLEKLAADRAGEANKGDTKQ